MTRPNQGFRQDLNFEENTNDTVALNNLGGSGIANDLRIIQNNLRNISTISYQSISDGYFFFGSDNIFVYTNDDIVGVSENVSVGSTTLFINTDYYVCNSDGETKFKLSTTPSNVGISTISVSGVSTTSFNFIRKEFVVQENILNFIKPEISDQNFSYFSGSINDNLALIQDTSKLSQYSIEKKYKGNVDTTTNSDINIEGSVVVEDPARLNTSIAGLSSSKSPGLFIGDIRAFSSDNNPWTKVGTALSTSSDEVSIGELYFADNITITGIGTELDTSVQVTSFTHKLPIVVNGETYYLLLRT